MIRMNQMSQFLHDNVIDDRQRSHHALPVEVQVAAGGAGGPAVFEVHDPDGFGLHSHLRLKVGNSWRNSDGTFGTVKFTEDGIGIRG